MVEAQRVATFFALQAKAGQQSENRWILNEHLQNKGVFIDDEASSVMKWGEFIWTLGVRLKPSCIPPVNMVIHDSQIESLCKHTMGGQVYKYTMGGEV